MRHGKMMAAAGFILSAAMTLPLFAQAQPAPGGGGGGGPGAARPGFDPAAIRERIMDRMKTAMDCTDDEWKIFEPKLIKIVLLRMDVGGGMFSGSARFSGFIRQILDPNGLPSQVSEKLADLQRLIAQNETSNDAYKTALAQLAKAREKAKEDLAAATKDLTDIVNVRQEATLVDMGLLD